MFTGKAIIVIGARQVGKSTLFNMVLERRKEPALQFNCDEPEVHEMLSAMNTQELKWNPKRANTQFPNSFLSTYKVKGKAVVTPENWLEWVK